MTDEQLTELFRYSFGLIDSRMTPNQQAFCRAIESAACAERDKRIAELEAANEEFAKRQEWWNERMVELERQLEEARNDAERWKMTIEISQDVLRHPDRRKIPASVAAYMDAIHKGYDMTYAVDAAIDAAMQKGQS